MATCDACHEAVGHPRPVALVSARTPVPAGGAAGASAQREYVRRARRELDRKERAVAADTAWREKTRTDHPVLGRLVTALHPQPVVAPESQATGAWAKGAVGERRVGQVLDQVHGVRVLHDRRIPRSKANIDHLVVGPSGVFVIDAKHYDGKVEKRNVAGWFRTDERLFVKGRDRTSLLDGLERQAAITSEVLRAGGLESVPVHRMLCFIDATWPLFSSRPLRLRGMTALWPEALAEHVATTGPLDAAGVAHAADVLAGALRPA